MADEIPDLKPDDEPAQPPEPFDFESRSDHAEQSFKPRETLRDSKRSAHADDGKDHAGRILQRGERIGENVAPAGRKHITQTPIDKKELKRAESIAIKASAGDPYTGFEKAQAALTGELEKVQRSITEMARKYDDGRKLSRWDASTAKKLAARENAVETQLETMQRTRTGHMVKMARTMDKIFPDFTTVKRMVRESVDASLDSVGSVMPSDGAVLTMVHGKYVPVTPKPVIANEFDYALKVYISGGQVCVLDGHHWWWNQSTQAMQDTPLSSTSLVAAGGAMTIFVKRIRDPATDAATATLEHSSSDAGTVMAGADGSPEEKRWVLAEIDSDGIVYPDHVGSIYEHRVS